MSTFTTTTLTQEDQDMIASLLALRQQQQREARPTMSEAPEQEQGVRKSRRSKKPSRKLVQDEEDDSLVERTNTRTNKSSIEDLLHAAATTPTPPSLQVKGPSRVELEEATNERLKAALHSWYQRLSELESYKERHGHTRVPQSYAENMQLGIWVNKQRMEYKIYQKDPSKSSLTPIKLQHLANVQFEWAKPKGEVAWKARFRELREYKAKHGHCNVPTKSKENKALGRWVSTQRAAYKKYLAYHHQPQQQRNVPPPNLTKDQIRLLNNLGFVWAMPLTYSDTALVNYKKKMGEAREAAKRKGDDPPGEKVM